MGVLGLDFTVQVSDCDEQMDTQQPITQLVTGLALQKAQAVAAAVPEPAVVLGADTVVACGQQVLGKPKDAADAARMLRSLSGRPHRVYTGYCLRGPSVDLSGHVVTEVFFNDLSDEWIAGYVATGSPLDKAGAYGIQDDARLVRRVCGSYTNVVGLPEEEIRARLAELGVLS